MNISEIRIRDPYVLKHKDTYYLFGSTDKNTWGGKATGFDYYISKDLSEFQGPFTAFRRNPDFWADENFWAPEVYEIDGQFYMAASFWKENHHRGVQFLKTDSLEKPFQPIGTGPVTPSDWDCLDGTLYIEDGKNYLIFSHEWTQIRDGEICIAQISKDFTSLETEPQVLFKASEAPWTVLHSENGKEGYVTDGPWIFQCSENKLGMIWSSFCEKGYAIGTAYSTTGIHGPWKHQETPLIDSDGGHGMIFHTTDNNAYLAYHGPNILGKERAIFRRCNINENGLEIC